MVRQPWLIYPSYIFGMQAETRLVRYLLCWVAWVSVRNVDRKRSSQGSRYKKTSYEVATIIGRPRQRGRTLLAIKVHRLLFYIALPASPFQHRPRLPFWLVALNIVLALARVHEQHRPLRQSVLNDCWSLHFNQRQLQPKRTSSPFISSHFLCSRTSERLPARI